MSDNNHIKNFFFHSSLAILLSYVFIYLIPWHDIKYFHDFEVYKSRVAQIFTFGSNQSESFGIFLLFSELLWTNILRILPLYFYDIESGLTFISFICLAIYTFFTIKNVNPLLSFILLFNPIFIDLIISQVRIGVSFCLLLIAHLLRRKLLLQISLIVCATLIHTATLLLVTIFLILSIFKKFLNNDQKYLQFSLILPVFIMFFLNVAFLPILDFFGGAKDRTIYITNPIYSSIFFSLPWLFFSTMIVILPKNDLIKKNIDYLAYAASMGSLFFFSSVFQFYGSRFVAVSFPLFIISINHLATQFRYIMFIILFLYQIIYFSYWL
tara:strand:- start:6041 stop:7015 length:975 start_codon:yes stop_codon:yes gene_type:complete